MAAAAGAHDLPMRTHLVGAFLAHSMGGLDARDAVSTLGYGDRVASVTTIATPHRGSAVAHAVLGFLPDAPDAQVNRVIDALATAWSRTYTREDLADDTDLRAAFESLAERNADAFNRANPDDPRVYCQSWAGVSRPGGGLRTPSALAAVARACGGADRIVGNGTRADFMDASLVLGAVFTAHGTEFRPGDGMLTVASATWGDFRGCLPADHLDEVGQPAVLHQGASRWTGFDHRLFYRTVAFDLAARGF